ncbi:hypothetical protein [Clostridium hydrogeniformans]|uniref:hypothetical protein n=1 Tax=Clostridium hydrogeniformans TaxID=349933 RepID=UPI000483C466|nr:hypothetical protein [Clostridium hydrogeniformans]
MDIKKLIEKNKNIAIILTIALVFGFIGGTKNMTKSEYNTALDTKQKLDKQVVEIDSKIEECKKEVEILKAQKDEKEKKAKAEADRILKEKKAKEEADRIAKAESNTQAQQETNSNKVDDEKSVLTILLGEKVWISEKGNKYHKNKKCVDIKSKKVTQVSIKEAKSKGNKACKECY